MDQHNATSVAWQQYKAGFPIRAWAFLEVGGSLHPTAWRLTFGIGIFSQSNFRIVTDMGMALMPSQGGGGYWNFVRLTAAFQFQGRR